MRVFKSAKIVIGPDSVLHCVVRDLTNDGARITIANAHSLPSTMSVTFDNARTCRSSRLAWRTLDEFGVEFVGAGHAAYRYSGGTVDPAPIAVNWRKG